jgi:hypothetical protein
LLGITPAVLRKLLRGSAFQRHQAPYRAAEHFQRVRDHICGRFRPTETDSNINHRRRETYKGAVEHRALRRLSRDPYTEHERRGERRERRAVEKALLSNEQTERYDNNEDR